MSKSLGNSPDPIALMEKYGADGVRMGMLLTSPPGNDLPFDESVCEQDVISTTRSGMLSALSKDGKPMDHHTSAGNG
jgi:valyl-tRNA synthetase